MSEVIRTTVPVRPEVHAAFKRLADVQGVSLGRAIGDWLSDTFEAAEMVTAKMQKAKTDPVRVIRNCSFLPRVRSIPPRMLSSVSVVWKRATGPPLPRYVIRGQSP